MKNTEIEEFESLKAKNILQKDGPPTLTNFGRDAKIKKNEIEEKKLERKIYLEIYI